MTSRSRKPGWLDLLMVRVTGLDARGPGLRGPTAMGALALGAVAVGRLAIGRAVVKRLDIEELTFAACGSRSWRSSRSAARSARRLDLAGVGFLIGELSRAPRPRPRTAVRAAAKTRDPYPR
jgi:hypothetical protein